MARLTRVAILALALAAVLVGTLQGTSDVTAGNGYEQWTDGYTDGCYYYWDGYAYTAVACPRGDGGFDFYLASSGQWAYTFSTGFLSDGGIWLYYQGQYYVFSAGYGSSKHDLYPTTATIGAPTYAGLTDNVLVNQILLDSNNAIIDNILAPNCVEIVGDTCYY